MKTKSFLDIFSRKSPAVKKQIIKPKILADYREKNCLVYTNLIKLGFVIEFKELKVADYIVRGVAIERKTVSDFISSMINRRLLRQLEELQQYPNKLLIIEGTDEQELYTDSENEEERFPQRQLEIAQPLLDGKSKKTAGCFQGMHPNSVRGFLLSILLKHKVPIIFTKDAKDTAKFISVIAKKKNTETPLNVKKKTLNKKEQLQFIIESFPGIGPKTARKLLKEFKTIKNIINTPLEKLQEFLGKKSEIFKLIEEKY